MNYDLMAVFVTSRGLRHLAIDWRRVAAEYVQFGGQRYVVSFSLLGAGT